MSLRDITLLLFIIAIGAVAGYSQGLTSKDIVGKWTTGGVSADTQAPGKGEAIRYEFRSNGTYTVVGLHNATMYGCTTTLFNDMWGNYELDGDRLTLTPMRNFWRRSNPCAPGAETEMHYVLVPETFDVSTQIDEQGRGYLCLQNQNGESCFRREAGRVRKQ